MLDSRLHWTVSLLSMQLQSTATGPWLLSMASYRCHLTESPAMRDGRTLVRCSRQGAGVHSNLGR